MKSTATGPLLADRSGTFEIVAISSPRSSEPTALPRLRNSFAVPGDSSAVNELLDAVWPGLVVEENNLQVQVSALRKLLGAHAIATIPGRGYRFALAPDAGPFVGQATSAAVAALPDRPTVQSTAGESLIGREGDKLHILPLGTGQRQTVVTDPPWAAVAVRLIRGL